MNAKRNWRRYVAGLAFVAAVALLASRTCEAESSEFTVRFRLGDGAAAVQHLRAELYAPGGSDLLHYFESRPAARGNPPIVGPWPIRVASGEYRIHLRIETERGLIELDRTIAGRNGADITVPIEEALSAGP